MNRGPQELLTGPCLTLQALRTSASTPGISNPVPRVLSSQVFPPTGVFLLSPSGHLPGRSENPDLSPLRTGLLALWLLV